MKKNFAIFVACLVFLPALISGMGGKIEIEDKEQRHELVKEALESLEAYSNNLFARVETKVWKNFLTSCGKISIIRLV